MAHYERDYAREGDRDRKLYDRQRYYTHSDHIDRGRLPARTQSQGQYLPRPPKREPLVPEFRRDFLENQRKQVLLATVPYDEKDVEEHALCKLLRRSADNQERVIRAIERLADILSAAGDFVAACSEATTAATEAEQKKSDLDERMRFLDSLNKGLLTTSVENFFSLPDAE